MSPSGTRWWQRLTAPFAGPVDAHERWVVIDTETTGLDPANDALIAIGGVAVGPRGVRIGDSFEAVVRRDGAVDARNVVVHGLGREAQLAGVPAAQVLRGFIEWVGEAHLVGYHAAFDREVIERAARGAGLAFPRRPWLDCAPLAAAIAPADRAGTDASLDACLAQHGLVCGTRHNAAGDALTTAELLVKLRRVAEAQGRAGFSDLIALTRNRRWLPGA